MSEVNIDVMTGKYPERDKRMQRIQDCVALKQPDRLPVGLQTTHWLAKYGGISYKEMMYDQDKGHEIALRACEEFQPDWYECHAAIGTGPMFERIGFKQLEWPGHGVSDNSPFQYLDKEYMPVEEYDDFLLDPTGYYLEKYLPRIAGTFDGLQPLASLAGQVYVRLMAGSAVFAMDGVVSALENLKYAGEAALQFVQKEVAFAERLAELGVPVKSGGSAGAPYDSVADYFRGGTNMMKDTFRHKDKLHQMLEKMLALQLKRHRDTPPMNYSNIVFIPIHWGPDAFMSQKTFETFFWPTLRDLIYGLVDLGRIPWVLWEHDCTNRLETIREVPAGKCIYWFEKTDLVTAWETLGDVVCVKGNVKAATLATGTPEQVDAEVKHLVDNIWNKGGCMFLEGSTPIPDETPIENVRAYFNAARKYGG